MALDWTKTEVDLAIADYMAMLSEELKGNSFIKAVHRKALLPLLNNRSEGSIERKHQNISAILIEFGYPYISGYKPLGNYQGLLLDRVSDFLLNNQHLGELVGVSVDRPAETPEVSDYLDRLVSPPVARDHVYSRVGEQRPNLHRHARIDYLEREARNASLGKAGEQFVVEFEKSRLIGAGAENLADKVEHISVTRGDGLGFDVRSYEADGRDRLIEVKTTAGGKQTPFYVTRNEVEISRQRTGEYHLYRVFAFRKDPRLFSVCGALDRVCRLDATQYSASIA